ncbi:hypothetical protein KK083_01255 [Fulvivirgaceae bacterium PWU4]|uniref:Uncharacterized protein n=1 Tax=Chryseosolibacter histidini TaxID=2782349 RepID=A0AAP2GL55_9BACT|nr:hypothetical protein [Chryseosolibacter histidini]MBT1695483.1 hypothetical protein [Chryseosolibacter histidini]
MEKTFYSSDHVLFLHFEISGVLNGYMQRNNSPIRQALKGVYIEQESGFRLSFFIEKNFGERLNILMAFCGEIASSNNKETMRVSFLTLNENFSQIEDPVQGEMAFTTEKQETWTRAYQKRIVLPDIKLSFNLKDA